MKRSILSALVVAAFLAVTGSASAHVVTKAEVTCTGVTVSWTSFPGGTFDMNLAFQDQIGGKAVGSPYVVAHLSGSSGTKFIPAPAANGVTFRKVVGTWTVDGGGSFTATATVKSCNCKPTTPPRVTTTTTPGTTVTTPGSTVTTPGVTTPGVPVTVTITTTITAPPVTVTAPAVTTTTPGKTITKTVIKHVKSKPKVKIVYRNRPITVHCPNGGAGSYNVPLPTNKPIQTHCSYKHQGVKGAGATG